jgi:hypothetical protein
MCGGGGGAINSDARQALRKSRKHVLGRDVVAVGVSSAGLPLSEDTVPSQHYCQPTWDRGFSAAYWCPQQIVPAKS